MKQKIAIGLVVLALVLSSCETDTWTQGTLDYNFSPTTDSHGYFQSNQIAYPEDIAVTGNVSHINDFNFVSSRVMVTGNLLAGDVIRDLIIDIDGVGQFAFSDILVTTNGWSMYIVDSGSGSTYYNFMMNAFNYMRQYGKQDILVSGYLEDQYGRDVAGATVQVNIENDLNVNVTN